MSKYEPLRHYLMGLRSQALRASFDDIEEILGFPLPRSAYKYPAWWSNDGTGHSHSRAWLDIGWKTENVDIEARAVTFRAPRRDGAGGGGPDRTVGPKGVLFGALAGTVRVSTAVDLTEPTGDVWSLRGGQRRE